jgi:hypothetical protein
MVRLHPHARERMEERGATEEEVRATVSRASHSRRSSDERVFDETFGLTNTGVASIITPNRLKPTLSKRDLTGWSLPWSHATFEKFGRSKRREIHL